MRAQAFVLAILFAIPASAQQKQVDSTPSAVAPGAYRVLPPAKLYPGAAPGSEGWTIPESIGAASVELTSDDLREIDDAASKITVRVCGFRRRC